MPEAILEGSPYPDESRENDKFIAIYRRIDRSTVTEPFARDFGGEVLPIDKRMQRMLSEAAERGLLGKLLDS